MTSADQDPENLHGSSVPDAADNWRTRSAPCGKLRARASTGSPASELAVRHPRRERTTLGAHERQAHQSALRDPRDPRGQHRRSPHRRGGPADLPGLDLQAGRRRRPARRLRVQPQRQPHPHRPGGEPRRPGGRPPRPRLRVRPGRRGLPAAYAAQPRRPRGHPQRRVRRHVPALREGRRRGGAWSGRSPTPRDPAAVRAALTPKTKAIWVETPSNPLLGITDIAAVAADRPGRGRAARRRQHLRQPVPPAAAGARRGRRRALH